MGSAARAERAAEEYGVAAGLRLKERYREGFETVLGGGLRSGPVPSGAEGELAIAIAAEVARARYEVALGVLQWNFRIFVPAAVGWLVVFSVSPWAIAVPALITLAIAPVIALKDVR